MMKAIWPRMRQLSFVRIVMKVLWSVKQDIARPAPIIISLEDLAPVWLRHNHDFRPSQGTAGGNLTAPVMSMAEALAPPVLSNGETLLQPATPVSANGTIVAEVVLPRTHSSLFVRDFVVPYQGIIERQNALTPLLKIIDAVEEYGQCPSVVLEAKTQDEESGDLLSIRDTLAQVTLRDHTHRVTKHGIAVLLATYKDAEPLIPKMLVACLAHDLGKIPAFRQSGIYSMRDHPAVSVVKVRELFQGHEVFWLDEVCQVIQAHHRHVKDGFSTLLKEADGHAREEEVAMASGTFEIKSWEQWFDVPSFLRSVEPYINLTPRSKKEGSIRKAEWVGFTHKGIVYCQAEGLFRVVKEYAKERKVIDIHLLRQSDRDHVMRQMAGSLQKAGVLGETIGEGFYGRKYSVRLKDGKQMGTYCLPIIESSFETKPSDLEKRKAGFFLFIDDVVKV